MNDRLLEPCEMSDSWDKIIFLKDGGIDLSKHNEALLKAQDTKTAAANNAEWVEWIENSGVFEIPKGHTIRSVEPHHGEFEHNPNCRVCRWQERKKEVGL